MYLNKENILEEHGYAIGDKAQRQLKVYQQLNIQLFVTIVL